MNRKQQPADPDAIMYGKVPPQARDMEEAVLGACLVEGRIFDRVTRYLTAEAFYVDAHSRIYRAMERLNKAGQPIDLLTTSEQLRKDEALDEVGGVVYLSELTNKVGSSANVEVHAAIVAEKYMARQLITASSEAIQKAYEGIADPFDLVSQAAGKIAGITNKYEKQKVTPVGAQLLGIIMEMKEAQKSDREYLGLPSGIRALDKITLGLTAPDMTVLAAGAGEGKSTLALQIATYNAKASEPVAYFSLEMGTKQLVWKIISSEISAQVKEVRKGTLTPEQWEALEGQFYDTYSRAPLYMNDVGGLSVHDVVNTARLLVVKYGVKLVVVDYLQLLSAQGADRFIGNREQEISYITKKLKAAAMELNVPILALSQLSRPEKGAKRLYKLSDLRESGAIEQDADNVMFIYRPWYHDVKQFRADDPAFEEDDVILQVAKWRLGDTGRIDLKFDGKHNKFYDPDDVRPEYVPVDYSQPSTWEL